ncbi:MAG: long-chain fatty acid--CoA ligase [Thermoanaerobaculia bacterium]
MTPVIEALPAKTLVDYFRFAAASGKADLLLWKVDGAWAPLSAEDFGERTRGLALGLALLGVDRQDRVAILSENRPEWPMTDFATLSLGAMTVPIYTSYLAPQVEYILKDSLAKVVVVSNAIELQKVLDVRERCPDLRHVVVLEQVPWSAGKAVPFETVVQKGLAALSADPEAWEERAESVFPTDLATMIYTSGTTGEPKGAILTHENFVSNVATCSTLFEVTAEMVAMSFLPLSHVFERMVDYLYFSRASTIAYAESIDKLSENFAEVRPHCFAAVPRVYEKMLSRIQNAVDAAPRLRRGMFAWGVRTGAAHLRALEAGEKPPFLLRLKYRVADRLVFGKIKARLGGRFRFAISGGAPLAYDVAAFFWGAGVEVYEGYGLTETSPVLACNRPGEWRLGTVGRPIPGVEIRIAPDGEVLAKGPNIMEGGYWRKKEETASVFDADGWFLTGDIGRFDLDGFLTLTDRKKEILINAYGKNIAPAPIEAALKAVRFVSAAVLIGDRRKFLSALVVPNFEKLESWAVGAGVAYHTRQDLVGDPRVLALFKQAIEILNGDEPHERQIRAFRLLTEDFSIEGGELTPTLKIKRRVVASKYRDVIDEMYDEAVAHEDQNADAEEG